MAKSKIKTSEKIRWLWFYKSKVYLPANFLSIPLKINP
jgi:hypothetical protein